MPTQVNCPGCRRPLRVPDQLLGQKVKCPGCSEMFVAATGEEFRTDAAAPSRHDSERYREAAPPPSARREESDYEQPIRPTRRPVLDDDDFDDDDYLPRRRRRYLQPHRGGLVLTLGILSPILWLLCGPVGLIGIAAWAMGRNDLRAMREERMDPDGRGITLTGYVLGIVGTALSALTIVLLIVLFAIGALQ